MLGYCLVIGQNLEGDATKKTEIVEERDYMELKRLDWSTLLQSFHTCKD
jgi:hypothetical protein